MHDIPKDFEKTEPLKQAFQVLNHTVWSKEERRAYEIKMDEAPDYNRDDFVEYFWLTPKAALERISSGDKAKSDLPKVLRIFFGK